MTDPSVQVPFVQARGLSKHYLVPGGRRLRSVDQVSFSIGKGEVLGLVGESGCGKSTVARLLTRLSPPTAGSFSLGGEDVFALRGERLRRKRTAIQLVFQNPATALDPRMRLGNSMEAPLAQHGIGTGAERRAKVMRMLTEVGLDESFYARLPRECSGGQLQRVVIGRALLLQPAFLVCDEPTSALDASMRTQILNLLTELRQRLGLTILLITHDLRVVRHLSDRIAVMYLGQIVETAPTEVLFEAPRHPYTRALIASSLLEENGLYAAAARGEPPSPLNPPSGCHFHTRCACVQADCARVVPELRPMNDRQASRCLYSERLDELDLLSSRDRASTWGTR